MEYTAKPGDKIDVPKEILKGLKYYAVLGSGTDVVCLWSKKWKKLTGGGVTFIDVMIDTSHQHQGKVTLQKRTLKPWLTTTRDVVIIPMDKEVTDE